MCLTRDIARDQYFCVKTALSFCATLVPRRVQERTFAMTEVQELAAFVDRVQLDDLSEQALEQLKIRVLDTIGVAIGALTAGPNIAIGALTAELGHQMRSLTILDVSN
jgi:hypothetical protein